MTVENLIVELSKLPPEMEVVHPGFEEELERVENVEVIRLECGPSIGESCIRLIGRRVVKI